MVWITFCNIVDKRNAVDTHGFAEDENQFAHALQFWFESRNSSIRMPEFAAESFARAAAEAGV